MPLTLRKTSCIFSACFLFLLYTPFTIHAQSVAAGPYSPSTAGNESFPGSAISFSNVSDVFTSNNSRATAAALVTLFTGQTAYLKTTNYGFSIPASTTIKGIEVQVEKSGDGIGNILFLESYITDYRVRLVKNGTVTGNNYATSAHWSASDNYYTYGGSTDLWGITWTPADINAADFGFAFSADIHGLVSLLPTARIDHIRITVYYEEIVLPLPLVKFTVTATNKRTIAINWETGIQNEPGVFEVQRSKEGKNWEAVPGGNPVNTVNNTGYFSVTDNHPLTGKSFYRLKKTAASGKVFYSESKSITLQTALRVKIFPNPFTSYLTITGIQPGAAISLFDSYGKELSIGKVSMNHISAQLELNSLRPGIYYLAVEGKRFKIQKW